MTKQNSDEELKMQISTLLKNDRNLGSYGLNCDVVNGEVQLQGIVDTLREKSGQKIWYNRCQSNKC